jgi:aminoglycoside phosphotransferase (APT) family kinase protein
LLRVWKLRLSIHRDGRLKWSQQTLVEAERLVSRLGELSANEEIEIDAPDASRNPIARFIRVATGEVLAELHQVDATP